MTLLLITLVALSIVIFLIRKDRLYLKKDITEVMSDEVKKELNFPREDAPFVQSLVQNLNKVPKQRASETLLKELNEQK